MTITIDELELLGRDDVVFGDPYVTQYGVGRDIFADPAIDSATMSVRMRISTDIIDRESMAMNPAGCNLDYYQDNPAVLFAHGERGIILPVAMSEDPEGQLAVELADDGVYARAYHVASNQASSQMFDAINCGLLRACSVGGHPIEVHKSRTGDGREVLVIDQWYLNEWSYCDVGVNPEAVIKSMGSGREKARERWLEAFALQSECVNQILKSGNLDGKPILPAIKKSLLRLQPKAPKRHSPEFGYRPSEDEDMTTTTNKLSLSREEVSGLSNLGLMKALTKMVSYDEPTQKMLDEEVGDREQAADSPEDIELEKTDTGEKQGSAATRAGYDALSSALEVFREALLPVELTEYTDKVGAQLDTIAEALETIAGYHAETYPDAPSITGGEVDQDAELLKSLWHSNEPRRVAAVHIARTLGGFAEQMEKGGRLDSVKIAKALRSKSVHLERMIADARDLETVPKSEHEAVVAERDKYHQLSEKLVERLDALDETPAEV